MLGLLPVALQNTLRREIDLMGENWETPLLPNDAFIIRRSTPEDLPEPDEGAQHAKDLLRNFLSQRTDEYERILEVGYKHSKYTRTRIWMEFHANGSSPLCGGTFPEIPGPLDTLNMTGGGPAAARSCGGTRPGFVPPESLMFRGSVRSSSYLGSVSAVKREGFPWEGFKCCRFSNWRQALNSASFFLSRRAASSAEMKESPPECSVELWPSAGGGPGSLSTPLLRGGKRS